MRVKRSSRTQAAREHAGPRAEPARLRLRLGSAVAVALAITGLVAARPEVPFAVRSTTLHAAVETAAGCVALLAALLAFGRFQRRRLAPDLALSAAFLVFGLANLCFSVVPTIMAGFRLDAYDTWAALAVRLAGALLLAAASLMPARRLPGPRAGWWMAGGVVGLLAAVATVVFLAADMLPAGVGLLDEGLLDLRAPTAYPVIAGTQGLAFVLYGLAVAGFARRARRDGDELAGWLATAAVLAATARVHYILYPSLYTDVVYSGDLLRFGFYVLVLVGVARELVSYWRELARAQVTQERRRLARDLHDGLSQELAYINTHAGYLARRSPDDERLRAIASASRRALDEARRALSALTLSGDEPLDEALAQSAEEIAARNGARVQLDLQAGVDVQPPVREALLRITREAVANAVRHGGSGMVSVRLRADEDLRLTISDEGEGFDPEAERARASGFGLTSMTERAETLGGELRIRSAPGAGTHIEVVTPWPSPSDS